ncbi:hypothetical protein [Loigolactobacillus backii]|uniref:hypothetical protein n=1 Tax=Loigolactobacillus backii TaxID=375175 RepID=UPI0022FD87B0|nr:hypothetical protein [Loigolactobacillus backii]MDA5386981.1 hypothetical protein [Loigolactobacillus backii]MDA5389519.1 hypothetical protein [Loigolactobacillus backii]
MKKYLVVDEFTLPEGIHAFTRNEIINAESAMGALLTNMDSMMTNGDTMEEAALSGRLEGTAVGVYELVSGVNELDQIEDKN